MTYLEQWLDSIFKITEKRLEELQSRDITFDELCELVSGMTDRNMHTEARLQIAKFVGDERLVRLYKAIVEIWDVEDYMPPEINNYRVSIEPYLETAVRERLGDEKLKLLNGCL